MARVCSIHQPSYWPYLGLFDKIARSDVFVFLDDVQFVKNDFKNRNRIFTNSPGAPEADRVDWLTLPVKHVSLGQTIAETAVVQEVETMHKHYKKIEQAYGSAAGFKELRSKLESFFHDQARAPLMLADINVASTLFVLEVLGIKTEILGRSSAIAAKSAEPTQRLIDICKHAGADTYLAGAGGKEYMRVEEFERQGVHLIWQNWEPFAYEQKHSKDKFVPYLSSLDLILNLGVAAADHFAAACKATVSCSPTPASP